MKRVSACSCAWSAAPALLRRPPPLGRALPECRFRNAAPDPERRETRQDADEIHVAPRVGAGRADEKPDERCEKEADAEAALHEPRALAARMIGPELGGHRRARRPFRAKRDADEKPQHREREPIPRDGAEPGHQRIGQDRQHHHALAADVVGEDAADQPAHAPAQERDRDDRAGVGRNLGVLRRRQQLMERHGNGEDQRVGLIAVEEPAQVRGEKCIPLVAIEAAIPRASKSGLSAGHGVSLRRIVSRGHALRFFAASRTASTIWG